MLALLVGCTSQEPSEKKSGFSDDLILESLKSWYAHGIDYGGATVMVRNAEIKLLQKGELTEKKEIPIEVSVSGEHAKYWNIDGVGRAKFAPKQMNVVFYVGKTEFGKIKITNDTRTSHMSKK